MRADDGRLARVASWATSIGDNIGGNSERAERVGRSAQVVLRNRENFTSVEHG